MTVQPLGGWVATPGVMEAEIAEVDSLATQVGIDIYNHWRMHCTDAAGDKIPCSFQQFFVGYQTFLKEWDNFKREHSRYIDLLWGETYDQIQRYKQRVKIWRERAEKEGVKLVAEKPIAAKGFPWGKVIWGGVGIATIFAAAKIVPAMLRERRE